MWKGHFFTELTKKKKKKNLLSALSLKKKNNLTACETVQIFNMDQQILYLTCSVDASRVHGASKGGDLICFLRLQLCNCFLFYWGWRGCFGEGGWEHVLAFLDTLENTEDTGEIQDICVRNTHQDFGVSAGQWGHSKYKPTEEIMLNKQQSRTSYPWFWNINSCFESD